MRIFITSCLLSIASLAGSQSASLPLNFGSYAIRLGVSKDECFVMTNRMGEVGISGWKQSDWRRADIPKGSFLGATLEQPIFFNKDTGFVSGFIASERDDYDIIYHTSNGGLNWQAIKFGQDGWVDDATSLDNGEAWMSVAGSGIAYSSDYGLSWQKLRNPENKQRFTSIFFNTSRQGIVGSLWNMIALTNDNCKTWINLPTPLDQKKYQKTNSESRPEIERVAIYHDYLLCVQEDLVFYSRRDSINWMWMPDYTDFYTDPENSALFFETGKGNFVRSNNDFRPVHVFTDIPSGYDAKCKKGNLYLATSKNMITLTTDNQVVRTKFNNTEAAGVKPIEIGYTTKGVMGMLDNKIYIQPEYGSKWNYLFTFPFPLDKGSLRLIDYSSLMYDRGDDSLFYFSVTGNHQKTLTKAAMLAEFGKKGIYEINFSQGSQGCFHHDAVSLHYTYRDGKYTGAVEFDTDPKHSKGITVNSATITEEVVMEFIKKLPQVFDPSQLASIQDLNFTEEEYNQCKKDILDFKAFLQMPQEKQDRKKRRGREGVPTSFYFHRNNIDFDRLVRLVDSIKHLDTATLNKSLLNLSDMWSTTSFWKTIKLTNGDKQILSISNRYYEPNAFYFPWRITLNGHSIITTNFEINRFIQKVYPEFLNYDNKIEVLHKLVKDLY